MQFTTSRDCTFARSNQCENFRKSFFTLRNCFQSKYQSATSRDWFLRGVASAKIWQGEFSPCEIFSSCLPRFWFFLNSFSQLSWTSTPPCYLRSTITWAYHLLHLRSHIHDWIFLSPFCICFLYMIHVLYSEIVCTSCLYLVLNSLSLYKHHFLYLISSLTFLMVFESCGCTHTPWIPHHHKVYHSFLVFFDRNIGDNVHLGWGESWGSKYFLF